MLAKVQKRACRWLTAKWDNNSKQWDKSYFQSLSELNWQSLQQRRTYLKPCQTFNVLNGMDCIEFAKYWSYSGAQQTRFWHACTLQTVSSWVNAYRFSFFYLHHHWKSAPVEMLGGSGVEAGWVLAQPLFHWPNLHMCTLNYMELKMVATSCIILEKAWCVSTGWPAVTQTCLV